VGIWKFAGYYMLFFLAGLQSIPSALREAAVMEGASSLQRFFYLTLPMLQPTLSLVFITAFIYSFTQVDHVSVMTQGGPNNASTVLLFYIQQLANDTHDWGKASAATFITLLMLFAFSVVNIRVLERGSHHE
jgi:sn-glycerol 3-phosphate transport system permease protein